MQENLTKEEKQIIINILSQVKVTIAEAKILSQIINKLNGNTKTAVINEKLESIKAI